MKREKAVRIVSLSPNISMILFVLGEGSRIVGRTSYCVETIRRYLAQSDIPVSEHSKRIQQWEQADSVGGWLTAEKDLIKKLKATHVFSSGSCVRYKSDDLGLEPSRFHHFDTRSMSDLYGSIDLIGKLIDRRKEAQALKSKLEKQKASALKKLTALARRPKVYVERCICLKPEKVSLPHKRVMIGGHLAPDLVGLVNGHYNLVERGEVCRWIDSQKIVRDQPDVIVLNRCGSCPIQRAEDISKRENWADIPAIRNNCVFSLPNLSNPSISFPIALNALVVAINSYTGKTRT